MKLILPIIIALTKNLKSNLLMYVYKNMYENMNRSLM